MKNRVIQARIEDKTFEELEYLKSDLNMPETTQVLSFALHHLYNERKLKRSQKSVFAVMEELGMIGSMKAPSELSESYKEVTTKSLTSKHNLRAKNRAK